MDSGRWRVGRRALWRLLIGLTVLTAGLAIASPAISSRTDTRERECAQSDRDAAVRNAATVGTGPLRVTVLGDSYTSGYGLTDPADSWPTHIAAPLGATVIVDSLGGTGYVASPCDPGTTFADRAPTGADLVIVQGGLNDVLASAAAIRTGATELLDQLNGVTVVLIGPPAAPKWLPEAERVDRTLAEVAGNHGVQYVSTYDWPLKFAADGIHLTPSSHRTFAELVAEEIR